LSGSEIPLRFEDGTHPISKYLKLMTLMKLMAFMKSSFYCLIILLLLILWIFGFLFNKWVTSPFHKLWMNPESLLRMGCYQSSVL
jgi:hypothetical protein